MKSKTQVRLKDLHPKSEEGDQICKLIKETRGHKWYYVPFNWQVIRKKKY